MENSVKKELIIRRVVALISALILGLFYVAFGQTYNPYEKASSFRNENPQELDTNLYFNISVITTLDGVLVREDSLELYLRNTREDKITMFYAEEKTDLFLRYDTSYEIIVKKKGYSYNYFRVNTDAPKRKHGEYVNINLEIKGVNYDVGVVIWDKPTRKLHYYPSKHIYK